jgi:hypothetical protein
VAAKSSVRERRMGYSLGGCLAGGDGGCKAAGVWYGFGAGG